MVDTVIVAGITYPCADITEAILILTAVIGMDGGPIHFGTIHTKNMIIMIVLTAIAGICIGKKVSMYSNTWTFRHLSR
jgi:hypothetical protein